jgi:hypothetical protein
MEIGHHYRWYDLKFPMSNKTLSHDMEISVSTNLKENNNKPVCASNDSKRDTEYPEMGIFIIILHYFTSLYHTKAKHDEPHDQVSSPQDDLQQP